MSTYNLFISHSSSDSDIAQSIKAVLNNSFEGRLGFFFSPEMQIGANWKQQIQSQLSKCDAGLFIVTPDFSKSSWFTAEFTAFWMQNKPLYILTLGDVCIDASGFFAIVSDIQRGGLSDANIVRGLIKQLAESMELNEIPYDAVEQIVSIAGKYNVCTENKGFIPEPLINVQLVRDRVYKYISQKWYFELNEDKKTLRGNIVVLSIKKRATKAPAIIAKRSSKMAPCKALKQAMF